MFTTGNVLRVNSNNDIYLVTNAVFRDPSAWYYVSLVCDTTQALASNRLNIYVNGVLQTYSTDDRATYISQNADSAINSTTIHEIGRNGSDANFFDGYLTEVNFIDGQALTPNSFGTFNSFGVWQPITYGGSYGTNGFYLPFSNTTSTTTLGFDFSPQGNNWTTNNISLTAGVTYDSMTDVPTLTSTTAANYAVMNPLDYISNAFSGTASNGNLTVSIPAPTNSNGIASTIRVISASQTKFYVETTIAAVCTFCSLGMISGTNANYRLRHTNDITFAVNDVIMTAFDPATGKLWYGRNGTWLSSGNPAAGTNQWDTIPSANIFASSFSVFATNGSTGTFTTNTNFGQQPFVYTPPSGFLPLNTFNL
jgi:hypothetical protein